MKETTPPKDPKKKLWIGYAVIIAILFACNLFLFPAMMQAKVKSVNYSTFLQMLESKELATVQIEDQQIYFVDKNDTTYCTNSIAQDLQLVNRLESAGVSFGKVYNQTTWVDTLLGWVISLLPMIILIVWFNRMMRKRVGEMTGGANSMIFGGGKSGAKQYVVEDGKSIKFADVAGEDEEKEELKEVVEFLKSPEKFNTLGARIPHGVLLVGPPGTGKTLLARACAGEAGVPFYSISGSDFVEMYVGVGASRVRDLFDKAKKSMPCIIFIDEIDAVGRQRGAGLGGGHDEREQTLNQLLVEMDGFEANDGIIVMAATNRADILDKALLRPGRFDRQVYVGLPDVKGREEILKVHTKKKPLAPDVSLRVIAQRTAGFAGADLENLVNEAALLAARRNRKAITMEDIEEASMKVMAGPEKKSRVVTDNDKKITAYHEAGHAVVCKSCPRGPEIHEVTIIPRGRAAGYNTFRPENDDRMETKEMLIDQITIGLGGRVAEELVFPSISTGASGDIRSVSATAHKMITEWGMSDVLGPVFYGSEGEVFVGKNYQNKTSYSEEYSAIIDRETQKIIKSAYERALRILKDNFAKLETMAKVLLEVESISNEEVNDIMGGASVEDVVAKVNRKKAEFDAIHNKLRSEQPSV